MFKAGTQFRYSVSGTVDGRPEGIPYEEVYSIVGIEGDSVKVELISEKDGTKVIDTDTSYGSYIFRTEGFSRSTDSPIQIELEGNLVYVDVLEPPMRCGGGEMIYLGRDGVVYKDVKTQMWSRGVIFKETRKLLSITVDGRVYEDIKWVDDGESSTSGEDQS